MSDNVKWARWLVVAGSILISLTPAFSRAHARTPASQRTAVNAAPSADPLQDAPREESSFFEDLEQRTFGFFWNAAQTDTGLVPDRFPGKSFSSIAAVGFGLTAYPIGVERHYITREQAQERVLKTLRFISSVPNEHGFLYHFLDLQTGERAPRSELSTIDTTWLLAGALFCEGYFDTQDPKDIEIRVRAEMLYRRVDWTWAQHNPPAVSIGWTPEDGFNRWDWGGYNEAMMLYVLALGSPVNPISNKAWAAWTRTYEKSWGTFYGETHLSFAPLFGHQFSHVWIDFRGIHDNYMRQHGIDYFENSRRATLAQRNYAIANPLNWNGYGENVWGLSASDGPGRTSQVYHGEERYFFGYTARGAGLINSRDDGTLAPTALLSSLPFAPEIVVPAVLEIHHRYGEKIYSTYGFYDAFNPSFGDSGWYDQVYLGIDQGPILAMLENYRSGLIWRIMRANPYVQRGLKRAGFSGGWLTSLRYAGQSNSPK